MTEKKIIYTLDDILAILPHRPPFLFVDAVTKFTPETMIETRRFIRSDEPQFTGHFPQKPIMPGVLILDALAQTSGLLLGFSRLMAAQKQGAAEEKAGLFYLAAADMKFVNPSYPGDTLIMVSQPGKNFQAFHTFTVEAAVKRNVIAKGTLTLALVKEKA